MTRSFKAIDLFSGAGGSSFGASRAGVQILAGCDMWNVAQATYELNFPRAGFYSDPIECLNPRVIRRHLGNIDIVLASPECTNHSPAKGAAARCEKSKNTAFEVVRFAKSIRPRWIIMENVVGMRQWDRYDELLDNLSQIGYFTRVVTLNSVDFRVPQSRRRLFILCDSEGIPPEINALSAKQSSAASVISQTSSYPFTYLSTPRRAKATLERASRAIDALGPNSDFLIVYYGSDHAGGWQCLSRPLRTITTLDRFAYVQPSTDGHRIRMLQVPELKLAMGMPRDFRLASTTRRNCIRLLGNAVCPPVMKYIVNTLTRSG